MRSVDFLYVALAATALVHGGYLAILFRRYKVLSRQLKEQGRK